MESLFDIVISPPQAEEMSLWIFASLLGLIILRKYFEKASLPLPPSPKPYPIIGNLLDLPPADARAAEWWSQHKALYGPVSSVSILGSTYIIVNDKSTAYDLLDRRSLKYSSRPSYNMAKLCDSDRATPFLEYDSVLRAHRREFQRYIGSPNALSILSSLEEIEMHRLLLRILEEPDKVDKHIRRTTGAIVLGVAYGYTPALRGKDNLIDLSETAMNVLASIFDGGAWMVDIIPSIRHLPVWLPGMNFKRKAEAWRSEMLTFANLPFKYVQRKLANGTATSSCAAGLIENSEVDEDQMKWIVASFYAAGVDTSATAYLTFFLAMILRPDVQLRAQLELDAVVGRGRLPVLSDRANGRLPYIEAIMKETLRWNSVAPLGVPHVCTEEDQYKGYRIPKGAVIMANIWQIAHDVDTYDSPQTFMPERFLGPNAESDPIQFTFGYGRRICPGKELALQSLFLAISMTLATFNIGTARDENGREILPKCEFTTGGLSCPKPFAYSVKPRDEKAAALIQSVMDEHPLDRGDADELMALAEKDIKK